MYKISKVLTILTIFHRSLTQTQTQTQKRLKAIIKEEVFAPSYFQPIPHTDNKSKINSIMKNVKHSEACLAMNN